ncbi:MAG: prolipoprotein diacylglyceryl transferase [SAR324 cluster bacterium]|nr:prolipoprotein diacylglyceryl transferase [SAR324 cluster bacterium]
MKGWIYTHDLDPILFTLGPLSVGWYGLMYGLSFLLGYWILVRQARKYGGPVSAEDHSLLMTYIILGVVIGGRLGWVIFYGGLPYLYEPLRIFQVWKGGMSFHGGMLGVATAWWLFARRHNIHIVTLSDLVSPVIPLGLMLGRIGNFINGELYGKPTDGSWGVIFPGDAEGLPRHPTQLYEAFGEGLLLFAVLQILRPYLKRKGLTTALFLVGYGVARALVEFVRLPDRDIGYLWKFVTMGQALSLPMILIGGAWALIVLMRPQPQSSDSA